MNEPSLTRRAVGGDVIALRVLLVQTRSDLCRYVAEKTRSNRALLIDPEDIVQETHIAVFRHIGAFTGSDDTAFQRWIRVIALNRLRNAIQAQRAVKRGGGTANAGSTRSVEDSTVQLFGMLAHGAKTPSRCVARHEAVEAVRLALPEIPDAYQDAIRLVHIEGYTVKEAAIKLGRTKGSVRGLCRRGMRCLQDRFADASKYLSSAG